MMPDADRCWRCDGEAQPIFRASEGTVTVTLCGDCMMDWVADDFAILPQVEPECAGPIVQPTLFDIS